jgi:hypothetical protein
VLAAVPCALPSTAHLSLCLLLCAGAVLTWLDDVGTIVQGMLSQERQRFNMFLSKAFDFVKHEKQKSVAASTEAVDGSRSLSVLQQPPSLPYVALHAAAVG